MPIVSPHDWREAGQHVAWHAHDIFVREEGAGEPLVLVHGFPTSSWDWYRLWPGLTARHRVLAMDLLGFGSSSKPRDHRYRIGEQADLVEAMIARAGFTRCRLLAHDYGVTVAQELMARRRDGKLAVALDGVCLLNGGLFPETHRPLRTQRLLASRLGPLLALVIGQRRFAASMRAIWGSAPLPDDELDAMWTLVSHDRGVRALPALLGYIAERRAHRERWVGALTDPARMADGDGRLPVRLICGLADPISGAHMAARYRELVPEPDVVELPGVGHYPQLEAPEAVLAAVLATSGTR